MRHFIVFSILLFISCTSQKGDGKISGEYDGEMKDGVRHGKGKLTTNDGVYIGEFVDGYVSGFGEFIGNDGGSYQGYWLNQEWHGEGFAIWPSGDKCICEFKYDKIHGFASYTRSDGSKYTGYYENGIKSGVGKIEFVSAKRKGDVYIGAIEDDYMQGLGKYYFANGDSEEGIFKANKLVSTREFTVKDSLQIENKINSDLKRVTEQLAKKKKTAPNNGYK